MGGSIEADDLRQRFVSNADLLRLGLLDGSSVAEVLGIAAFTWLTRKDLGPLPPTILGSVASGLPPTVSTHTPPDRVTPPSAGAPPAPEPFGLARAGLNSNHVPLSSLAQVTLPSSDVTPAPP